MIKRALCLICFAFIIGDFCKAQSNNFQTVADAAVNTNGVQLSISVTNNLCAVGSEMVIFVKILNLSTNIIGMIEEGGYRDFVVTLTNWHGKTYQLTPGKSDGESTMRLMAYIGSGQSREWKIRIVIGNDVEPGDCKLKASTKNVGFELVSNVVKFKIK